MNVHEIISSGLLEQYALGGCTPLEAAQVELWLKQYPEVKSEFEAIQLGLENYALAHARQPAGNVKNRIFDKLNMTQTDTTFAAANEHQPVKVVGILRNWKLAAAAAFALLIGSAALNFIFYNRYNEASKELAVVKNEMTEMAKNARSMESEMDKLIKPVSLKGMEKMPDAVAKIYWIKNSGDVYIDAGNLPPAPAGKQYQFWGIVDGKPVDGGMIFNTGNGNQVRILKMKTFGKAEAFAISLEKEGGNPTPTEVVSMGKTI